jgi:hypothetical protein
MRWLLAICLVFCAVSVSAADYQVGPGQDSTGGLQSDGGHAGEWKYAWAFTPSYTVTLDSASFFGRNTDGSNQIDSLLIGVCADTTASGAVHDTTAWITVPVNASSHSYGAAFQVGYELTASTEYWVFFYGRDAQSYYQREATSGSISYAYTASDDMTVFGDSNTNGTNENPCIYVWGHTTDGSAVIIIGKTVIGKTTLGAP